MNRLRLAALLAIVMVSSTLDAAPRRRAVSPPTDPATSPEVWLRLNAFPLQSAELSTVRADLAPLKSIIGDADVVALGEATHGTREFHTIRIRMIDYLVRDMGFDVVAMEAPFPIVERVNAYVQGHPESLRNIVADAWDLGYFFWEVREIVDLIEWARAYNLQRGERPAVTFAGFDTYDHKRAASAVIDYLRPIDPAEATHVETAYSCVLTGTNKAVCDERVADVRNRLAARESELAAMTTAAEFADALQNATVVQQYLHGGTYGAKRDEYLAANTLWIKQHRGESGRVILWAHQAHLEKTPVEWIGDHLSMGQHLAAALGDEYVVIGTATRRGSFIQWTPPRSGRPATAGTYAFDPSTAGGYESFFAKGGAPMLLIPLRGDVPFWLREANTLQTAPANPSPTRTLFGSLPEMMDAIIYFDETTPARR